MTHEPVLLQEVLKGLALQPGEILVDATVNRGGHSVALCPSLGPSGKVIALDADSRAADTARETLAVCPCPVEVVVTNFSRMSEVLGERQVKPNAILFDLGLSSEQLAGSGRGFSFQTDEPLLMTLNREPGEDQLTAAQIVNSWPENELEQTIREYGEERFAQVIAKAITVARKQEKITSTAQLVRVIKEAVPGWYTHQRLHFATKTFQALRIATNDELNVLLSTLNQAWEVLAPGGRLAVISFHSLEARIVKTFFQSQAKLGTGSLITKHARKPSYLEVQQNPRARSAQLRIIQKVL